MSQGSFTTLQTGSGQPLVTDQQTLHLGGAASPEILFSFGFITDEFAGPGAFLDSFTVSFQSPTMNTVAVLVTIDASGPVWVPATPGGLTLTDSQVQRMGILPPATSPIQGRGSAFSVAVPLPPQLLGSDLTVTFDLFDNQNGISSLGWYSGLQVMSVPEPQSGVLIGIGMAVFAWKRSRKR